MKKLTTKFDEFINEELKSDTYLSAAEKLASKGHINRSKDLKEFSNINEEPDNINKISIDVNNINYIINHDNINIISEKDTYILTINFDEKNKIILTFHNYNGFICETTFEPYLLLLDINRSNALKLYNLSINYLNKIIKDLNKYNDYKRNILKIINNLSVSDFYKN
jgi:hypothetical protein